MGGRLRCSLQGRAVNIEEIILVLAAGFWFGWVARTWKAWGDEASAEMARHDREIREGRWNEPTC